MHIPAKWLKNLEKNIITEEMLGEAIFSVDERIKDVWNLCSDKTIDERVSETADLQTKEDKLFSLTSPVCIHREHMGHTLVQHFDDEEGYYDTLARCLCAGNVNGGGTYKIQGGRKVDVVEAYSPERGVETYFYEVLPTQDLSYNRYYVVGKRAFDCKITEAEALELEKKHELPVVDINRIDDRRWRPAVDIAPTTFVDKIVSLLDSGCFVYEPDPLGHEGYLDSDYIPDEPEGDVLDRLENALYLDCSVALSEKAAPLVFKMLGDDLDISRNEKLKAKVEKHEDKRLRDVANVRRKNIRDEIKKCRKRVKDAKTPEELESASEVLMRIGKRFSPSLGKPGNLEYSNLVGYFLVETIYPKCRTYDFANMQEMAACIAEKIREGDILLPEEIDRIALDYYTAHWKEIREEAFASTREEYDVLVQEMKAKKKSFSTECKLKPATRNIEENDNEF